VRRLAFDSNFAVLALVAARAGMLRGRRAQTRAPPLRDRSLGHKQPRVSHKRACSSAASRTLRSHPGSQGPSARLAAAAVKQTQLLRRLRPHALGGLRGPSRRRPAAPHAALPVRSHLTRGSAAAGGHDQRGELGELHGNADALPVRQRLLQCAAAAAGGGRRAAAAPALPALPVAGAGAARAGAARCG